MYCPHISILCLEAQGNKAALTQTLLHRVANKTFHLFQFWGSTLSYSRSLHSHNFTALPKIRCHYYCSVLKLSSDCTAFERDSRLCIFFIFLFCVQPCLVILQVQIGNSRICSNLGRKKTLLNCACASVYSLLWEICQRDSEVWLDLVGTNLTLDP